MITISRPIKHPSTIVSDAERGLGQNEFFFVFHPKIRLPQIELSGFECLIRWQHPEGGVLGPAEFVSVVEDSFLAGRFTELLIEKATQLLAKWTHDGYEDLSLAINLPAPELGRTGLPNRLSALLVSHGIAPARLEIELTDVVRPDQLDWLIEVVHKMQSVGVRVALDDFGSGFNSLTLLQQLPVDIVKFDRSLIKEVPAANDTTRLVESLIQLAKRHDRGVVVTGIETEQQFAWAQTLPDIEGQGFYICEPLGESEVDEYIGRHKKTPVITR